MRTSIQLFVVVCLALATIFFLDTRYRVLPAKLHAWSPIHHAGYVVTDITVTVCSIASVLSTCELSEEWHRIEKDLYLGRSWLSTAYVYVQRKKEENLLDTDPVVLDVRVGRINPGLEDKEQQGNAKWESRPGGLWLLRSTSPHVADSNNAITAVDVLYGPDAVDPRLGWSVRASSLLLNVDKDAPEPRISLRKGQPPKPPAKPQPRIGHDGRFKIVQVSDMHLATGLGICRDEFPATDHCEADIRTLEFVSEVLDTEKPDLVILSGDQINGETAPDSQTALFKMADLFVSRKIPYALIFGNHDDSGSMSREALMELVEGLPYSLSERGSPAIDGVGNYYIEVLARGGLHHSALTLYMLDTHAYSPDESKFKGYDWIKPSQITWFHDTASTLKASTEHKDYAHHHLDMAFIHIPLPEYGIPEKMIKGSGEWREPPTAPGFNSGFKNALIEQGVFAVSCGHDHVNDYCNVDSHSESENSATTSDASKAGRGKLWMCYAGGSGYGGYAGYGGFKRRVRVWEFDMTEGHVETWKRVDGEKERHDHKRVVRNGQVIDAE